MLRRTIRPPKHTPSFRRTIHSPNKVLGINYWDRDRKQRWGLLVKETRHNVHVRNVLGETVKIPQENVIARKDVDPFFQTPHSLTDSFHHLGEKAHA